MPNDSPPLSPNIGTSNKPDITGNEALDKSEILDLLSTDGDSDDRTTEDNEQKKEEGQTEEKTRPGKETEGSETEEDEEDKIKLEDEDEDEDKEITEEDLELTVPARRKDILAKYPTLFKDFPYLEKAYYREQQFTELFPTIDEAKESAEKAKVLDNFEADVMQGNTEKVLQAIKENDERAFKKAVDNYLPTLLKVDQSAYLTVVGNVAKQLLSHAALAGKQRGEQGQPLEIASKILSQFIFGTEEPGQPTTLTREDETLNKEREQLKKEREETVRHKFEDARSELASKVQNTLRSTINANIDPKNNMPEYVRKNASRDAYEALEAQMGRDESFKRVMNTLWRRAFDDGFSRNSLDKIRSAYLSKARTVLPNVIKSSRNEALKGLGRTTNKEENTDRKGPLAPGKTATSQPRGKTTDPKAIPKGVSTLDFLNMD